MTQYQFNQMYKETFPNWKKMTLTDRRLAYNDLMNQHLMDGTITEKQAYNWGHPKFLASSKNKIQTSKN